MADNEFWQLKQNHKPWTQQQQIEKESMVCPNITDLQMISGEVYETSSLCNTFKTSPVQKVKLTSYIILQLSRAHDVSNHPS